MKRNIHLFVMVCCAIQLAAQAPQGINYQAVVRNGLGNAIAQGTPVKFRFTIHDGTATGNPVYTEIDTTSANQFGLCAVVIGREASLGSISWGGGLKFLQVETDVNNTGTYTDMGTSQLQSVPYALFAGNSSPGPSGATGLTGPTGVPGATGSGGGSTGPTGPQGAVAKLDSLVAHGDCSDHIRILWHPICAECIRRDRSTSLHRLENVID